MSNASGWRVVARHDGTDLHPIVAEQEAAVARDIIVRLYDERGAVAAFGGGHCIILDEPIADAGYFGKLLGVVDFAREFGAERCRALLDSAVAGE